MLKFDKKLCIGLCVSWAVKEPWGDNKCEDIGIIYPKKPVHAAYCRKMYNDILVSDFVWSVDLKILFSSGDLFESIEYEFDFKGSVNSNRNDLFVDRLNECIKDAFGEKDEKDYSHCEVTVQIIGY